MRKLSRWRTWQDTSLTSTLKVCSVTRVTSTMSGTLSILMMSRRSSSLPIVKDTQSLPRKSKMRAFLSQRPGRRSWSKCRLFLSRRDACQHYWSRRARLLSKRSPELSMRRMISPRDSRMLQARQSQWVNPIGYYLSSKHRLHRTRLESPTSQISSRWTSWLISGKRMRSDIYKLNQFYFI